MNQDDSLNVGMNVRQGQDGNRLYLSCGHEKGLLYSIPSEASWVCSPEFLHVHALAGFFRELKALQNNDVETLLQRWGIFFRSMPIDDRADT